MKFGINQSISQTITQLSCIQLETPSSRLWNFWWIKTYTTFKLSELIENKFFGLYLDPNWYGGWGVGVGVGWGGVGCVCGVCVCVCVCVCVGGGGGGGGGANKLCHFII